MGGEEDSSVGPAVGSGGKQWALKRRGGRWRLGSISGRGGRRGNRDGNGRGVEGSSGRGAATQLGVGEVAIEEEDNGDKRVEQQVNRGVEGGTAHYDC
ncbi:hypothetical protein GW17_00056960 [Ensete ventricosum]|nr:hypothetical protein GW17_00056960 [Ensete ventricosum]